MSVEGPELQTFLERIYLHYGFDLRGYSVAPLQRRVQAAMLRYDAVDMAALADRLIAEPAIFQGFVDAITIHVSDMFRDPAFYRAFREEIVPVLRTYPSLKIWHAGCATGEEVYATVILLVEAGLYERTQIYATDLSATSVQRCKEGIYASKHLARFVANYQAAGGTGRFEDYCRQSGAHVVIDEALKRNVVYFQHDLVSDYVFGEMNVVFCRNVMIYFERVLRTQVIEKLIKGLCPGGFLCLGNSEQLLVGPSTTVLQPVSKRERIYRHLGVS